MKKQAKTVSEVTVIQTTVEAFPIDFEGVVHIYVEKNNNRSRHRSRYARIIDPKWVNPKCVYRVDHLTTAHLISMTRSERSTYARALCMKVKDIDYARKLAVEAHRTERLRDRLEDARNIASLHGYELTPIKKDALRKPVSVKHNGKVLS